MEGARTRLLPRPALAFPERDPRKRAGDDRPRHGLHLPAASVEIVRYLTGAAEVKLPLLTPHVQERRRRSNGRCGALSPSAGGPSKSSSTTKRAGMERARSWIASSRKHVDTASKQRFLTAETNSGPVRAWRVPLQSGHGQLVLVRLGRRRAGTRGSPRRWRVGRSGQCRPDASSSFGGRHRGRARA